MTRKSFTYIEINRIVSLRMAGWRPQEIGEMTERTAVAISRILSVEKKKRGLRYPKLKSSLVKWTDEKIESDIVRNYPRMKYTQIAMMHELSCSRISYLISSRAHKLQEGTWTG